MKIREVTKNDMKRFVQLKKQDFGEYSKLIGRKIEFSEASIKKEFARILSSKDEHLFVAEKEEIVGFVHGKIEKKDSKAKIEYIFVEKTSRKNGIAKSLINKFSEKATQQKVKNLLLNVNINNTKAINLYKKLGFKLNKYEMKKVLQ